MIISINIILSIVSALLYRLGGWGDEGRKAFPRLPEWLFNTKARDIGCAIVTFVAILMLVKAAWWIHFLAFGFLFACLTTYWDFLFGFDNHWFHGFMCGVAYFPYIFAGEWIGFLVRCFVLAILMGSISRISKNDVVEECGRGFVLVITILLFLL